MVSGQWSVVSGQWIVIIEQSYFNYIADVHVITPKACMELTRSVVWNQPKAVWNQPKVAYYWSASIIVPIKNGILFSQSIIIYTKGLSR